MTCSQSPDPRSQRSRAALQGALLAILGADPAPEVTIAALTSRAGVNRSTFYQHYRGVGQLLAEAVTALATDAGADLTTLPPPSRHAATPAALRELFEHADTHRSVYRAALANAASGELLQQLLGHFAGAAAAGAAPDVTSADRAAAGALLGCFLVWLTPGPAPAAHMTATAVSDWAWSAARLAASADTAPPSRP